MLASAQPIRLPKPFAASAAGAYIRSIPTASQIGIQNGAASLTDGFPPLTMTPIPSGGVPPFGQDMNGLLNWLSSINQWNQAGGGTTYDGTFATAIGGYPKGAVLQSNTLDGRFWRSTAENNITDPDGGGAGWASLFAPVFASPTFTGTLTASGPAVLNSTLGVGGVASFSTTVNLGNFAFVANQAPGTNNTAVANTAFVASAASAVQGAAATDATTKANAAQAAAISTASGDATAKANAAEAGAVATVLSQFSPSPASGTYVQPGIQYRFGSVTTASTPERVNFGVAFPSGILGVFATVTAGGVGSFTCETSAWDLGGFTLTTKLNGSQANGITVIYQGIGW